MDRQLGLKQSLKLAMTNVSFTSQYKQDAEVKTKISFYDLLYDINYIILFISKT